MENEDLTIKVVDQSVTARSRQNNRSGGPGLIVGVLLLLLGGGATFWWLSSSDPPVGVDLKPAPGQEPPLEPLPNQANALPTAPAIPTDDGQSLWTSPTNGQPLDCNYLLPGTQFILHVRVEDLLAHNEADKVRAALGPWGEQITQQLTSTTGVELSNIKTLLLGIRQSRGGSLDFCGRLDLKQPVESETLGPGCFLPEPGQGKQLVWCSPSALVELKSENGAPPPFPRELARILERTDSERTATLIFSGKFLQISGEKFLRGAGEKIRLAIVDFLGDEATASALSAHWDENFFLELRSTVALNARPHRFAALLETRVTESSDLVEDSLLSQTVHPHGRKVLARFPAMLRKLGNYTRSGEEDKLSLLRCYLPVTAGHNLLMASELLLNANQMGSTPTADALAQQSQERPESLAARLQQTTSLVFPKETLQKALEILSDDLQVPIQIAGGDLQLEGITRNQSLAIELRDRPASEILLAILLRANPDRTATGPSDQKQKLVYVLRETANGKPGAIVVTTRAAATRRGEKLPDVFRSDND